MYHYLENKDFQHKICSFSGTLMQSVCHHLKTNFDIGATFHLVGSGARKLILQNNHQPIDLDYDLEIIRCSDFEDCRHLKECVKKTFNHCLRSAGLCDCEDSHSVLSSKQICFQAELPRNCISSSLNHTSTAFTIDICITVRDEKDNRYRLIHEKTGVICNDRYFWNQAPTSKNLKHKVDYIKSHGQWQRVRDEYLEIKNHYLTRNDHNHPSFICYLEAVNNVYNSRKHW